MINSRAVLPLGFECMQRVSDKQRKAARAGEMNATRSADPRVALLQHILRQDSELRDGAPPANVAEAQARIKKCFERGDHLGAVQLMELVVLMRFGDGAGEHEPVSDDAVSHEMAELVTNYNSVASEMNASATSAHADGSADSTVQGLLRKALFLAERPTLLRVPRVERQKLHAATLNNLGCLFQRRGKYRAALGHLEKALRVEGSLGAEDGADPASTHLNLCVTLCSLRRHKPAMEHASHAINVLMEQLNLPDGSPVTDIKQGQEPLAALLAIAYYNLATQQEALRPPKFKDALLSLTLAAELLRCYPEGNEATQAAVDGKIALVRRALRKGGAAAEEDQEGQGDCHLARRSVSRPRQGRSPRGQGAGNVVVGGGDYGMASPPPRVGLMTALERDFGALRRKGGGAGARAGLDSQDPVAMLSARIVPTVKATREASAS